MTIVNFTPWSALIGGVLIGLAAALMWWLLGRVAGVSNILGQTFSSAESELNWRLAFLAGLVLAGVGAKLLTPDAVQFSLPAGYGQLIVAGLLVGFGTQLGSGCTSGHGVCGMSRLSPRSIVATLVFMAAGALAVLGLRLGGAL
ncbi:MAG TPA: YeeE/YedE family protein [Burkholderiales bacterium]|nr:YeeE/YedE family protein [Burkholderiales bacterium]